MINGRGLSGVGEGAGSSISGMHGTLSVNSGNPQFLNEK